jgi:hypothetical protein
MLIMQTEGGYPQSILFKVGSQWEVPSPTVHIKNFWNTGEGGDMFHVKLCMGGLKKRFGIYGGICLALRVEGGNCKSHI